MYNPLKDIRERIAPTGFDSYFRHQIIQDMFMIWELLEVGIIHAGIFQSMDC
jgi:hypothetical protein